MTVQLIAFYPTYISHDYESCSGTLHVHLDNHRIDIRGIVIDRNQNKFFVGLPYRYLTVGGKRERFPVVAFSSPEWEAIAAEIRERLPSFIYKQGYTPCGKRRRRKRASS